MARSTNWEQVRQALDRAQSSLPECSPPVTPGGIPAWTRARPFAEVTAADSAVTHWIERGDWPPLENDVAAELHLRMEAATMQTIEARKGKIPCPELRDALGMLLVQFWHGMGVKWVEWRYSHAPLGGPPSPPQN